MVIIPIKLLLWKSCFSQALNILIHKGTADINQYDHLIYAEFFLQPVLKRTVLTHCCYCPLSWNVTLWQSGAAFLCQILAGEWKKGVNSKSARGVSQTECNCPHCSLAAVHIYMPDFKAEPTNSVQILVAQPVWKSGHHWMQMARTWSVMKYWKDTDNGLRVEGTGSYKELSPPPYTVTWRRILGGLC